MEGRAAARAFSAGRSNVPEGSWTITAFGMPLSRISAVSARVSTPVIPTMPFAFSHASRWRVARQFEGSVMSACSTTPRAEIEAAAFTVSVSSSFTPTLPTCGKVKVRICPL